jgi:hypothetical protein
MTEYNFRDQWQNRPLIWNMPANPKRQLEHVTILHVICVLVAHWWAEAEQFWDSKNMVVALHAPYLPCDLFSFPWMKSELQGHWFQLFQKLLMSITCDNKMSIPAVLPTVAETMDTMHKLEQKWEIKKVTVYSFTDSGQELLDMPSCVKYLVLRHSVTIQKRSITMYDACFLIYLMTLPHCVKFMMSNDCKS